MVELRKYAMEPSHTTYQELYSAWPLQAKPMLSSVFGPFFHKGCLDYLALPI